MPAARTTVLTTAAATVKVREGMSLLSVSETSAGRPTCGERTDRPHTCHFGQTQGVTPQDRSGSKESSHAYPYRCRCAGRVSAVADRPDGAPADGALLAGGALPQHLPAASVERGDRALGLVVVEEAVALEVGQG